MVSDFFLDSIDCRILFAPITASKTTDLEKYGGLMGNKGYFIKEKDGNKFKIPKKYLEERKAVNQEELLSKIKMPVLILHGDNDDKVAFGVTKEIPHNPAKGYDFRFAVASRGSNGNTLVMCKGIEYL